MILYVHLVLYLTICEGVGVFCWIYRVFTLKSHTLIMMLIMLIGLIKIPRLTTNE